MEADVDSCNDLTFHLADAATVATQVTTNKGITTLATRTWDITISQIECTSATLPPVGCTKYFWNAAGRAQLTSHNWQTTTTSIHLGQQHDRYCVRRERGMCVGCYATIASNFAVSGRGIAVHYTAPGGCCGYHTQGVTEGAAAVNYVTEGQAEGGALAAITGLSQVGWDCIIIPGAFIHSNNGVPTTTQTAALIQTQLTQANTAMNSGTGPQICGQGAGIGAGVADIKNDMWNAAIAADLTAPELGVDANNNLSICTRSTPFILEFMSDDIDGLGGGTAGAIAGQTEISTANRASNLGFSITHTQLACT